MPPLDFGGGYNTQASDNPARMRGLMVALTMVGDERDFEMNASNNEDDGPVNAAQTNTKPSVMALT